VEETIAGILTYTQLRDSSGFSPDSPDYCDTKLLQIEDNTK